MQRNGLIDAHNERASRVTNPFATRWVRPGAIGYRFLEGQDVSALIERLDGQNWWGAVVGPHGSGKTALLATLVPAIQSAGRAVRQITLHDGQRTLPTAFKLPRPREPAGVIVVDGYEQLRWWSRRRLKTCCRRAAWGLVVSAHEACGIPELFRTTPTLEVVQALVGDLLAAHGRPIGEQDVALAYQAHPGNVREVLFALYDLVERRR